jgi:hypothetical protein
MPVTREIRWAHLPPDYLSRLGKLCVRWADLEHEAQILIVKLCAIAGADEASIVALTAHLGIRERFGALITILPVTLIHGRPLTESLEAQAETLTKAMTKLAKGISTLVDQRNAWTHQPWSITPGGVVRQLRVASKGRELDVRNIERTTAELDELIAKVMKLREDLRTLCLPVFVAHGLADDLPSARIP